MFKKKINYILIILLFSIQCKSTGNISYSNKISFEKKTNSAKISNDKIDMEKTYEVSFLLKNDEECIKTDISSYIFDVVLKKNKKINTYFIVEKKVDISKFATYNNNKILYSEIIRNFDNNWDILKETIICSSDKDPIKRLKKNNVFRIRFSTFRKNNYNFQVNIFSEGEIEILKNDSNK